LAEPNSSALRALRALRAIFLPMSKPRFAPILTDIQFWVPVAVLLLGGLILAWVSR